MQRDNRESFSYGISNFPDWDRNIQKNPALGPLTTRKWQLNKHFLWIISASESSEVDEWIKVKCTGSHILFEKGEVTNDRVLCIGSSLRLSSIGSWSRMRCSYKTQSQRRMHKSQQSDHEASSPLSLWYVVSFVTWPLSLAGWTSSLVFRPTKKATPLEKHLYKPKLPRKDVM